MQALVLSPAYLCFEHIAHITPPQMSASVTVDWVIGGTCVQNCLVPAFLKGTASEGRSLRLDLFVVTPYE